jgi:simple sugar transport system permease protein
MVMISSFFKGMWNRYKMQLAITIIYLSLWFLFLVANPFAFTSQYTYSALMSILPLAIIPALSLTYIVILGEIDLSFPSVMALASWILAVTWHAIGPSVIGVLLALLAGAAAGLLNGLITAKGRIPSFIATLGTMFFWSGIVLVASQGFGIPLFMFKNELLYQVFVGRIAGVIPAQMVWALVIAVIMWFFLNLHKFGAHVYYIGDSRIAAKAMGVNVDRIIILTFTIHGTISAFAGILTTLENATFWPTIGDIYLLRSIASVVVGGTPLSGGSGTIFGTFIGGLILGWIETGLLAAGVAGFWTKVFYGVVIITSLILQSVIKAVEVKRVIGEEGE